VRPPSLGIGHSVFSQVPDVPTVRWVGAQQESIASRRPEHHIPLFSRNRKEACGPPPALLALSVSPALMADNSAPGQAGSFPTLQKTAASQEARRGREGHSSSA
jgi:hypothetical protein